MQGALKTMETSQKVYDTLIKNLIAKRNFICCNVQLIIGNIKGKRK
jgi:hypothetical protein